MFINPSEFLIGEGSLGTSKITFEFLGNNPWLFPQNIVSWKVSKKCFGSLVNLSNPLGCLT